MSIQVRLNHCDNTWMTVTSIVKKMKYKLKDFWKFAPMITNINQLSICKMQLKIYIRVWMKKLYKTWLSMKKRNQIWRLTDNDLGLLSYIDNIIGIFHILLYSQWFNSIIIYISLMNFVIEHFSNYL